jgi:hypothetical protein
MRDIESLDCHQNAFLAIQIKSALTRFHEITQFMDDGVQFLFRDRPVGLHTPTRNYAGANNSDNLVEIKYATRFETACTWFFEVDEDEKYFYIRNGLYKERYLCMENDGNILLRPKENNQKFQWMLTRISIFMNNFGIVNAAYYNTKPEAQFAIEAI